MISVQQYVLDTEAVTVHLLAVSMLLLVCSVAVLMFVLNSPTFIFYFRFKQSVPLASAHFREKYPGISEGASKSVQVYIWPYGWVWFTNRYIVQPLVVYV